MRGIFLIGTLITLLIAGLVYKKTLKKTVSASQAKIMLDNGVAPPKDIRDLPAAVQKTLDKTVQKAEDRALEAIDQTE